MGGLGRCRNLQQNSMATWAWGAWYKDSSGPDERQGMPRPSWTRLFPRLTSSLLRLSLGVVRLQDLSRTDGVHACLLIPDMMEDSAESAPLCTRLPCPSQRTDKAIRSLIATCSSSYPITTSDLGALTTTPPDPGRARLVIAPISGTLSMSERSWISMGSSI